MTKFARHASLATLLLSFATLTAQAQSAIPGLSGPIFDLTAGVGYIDTPDGDSLQIWGYGPTGGLAQYPAPTLIVNQGDLVSVTLNNAGLPQPVSIVFPGQTGVTATGGTGDGLLAREVTNGGAAVTYTFTASKAGTYAYHSGTRPELQIEMGLTGALIVRPTGFNQANNRTAYGAAASAYVHEYLYFLSEIDPEVHKRVEFGFIDSVDNTTVAPVLWFVNGRNAPDVLAPDNAPWMPHQPYSAITRMHPGERVLMRVVGGGRDLHPWHHHGNHSLQIARDGRLLESAPGAGPDLAVENFTIQIHPGATYDAIFSWRGTRLGWDIYGHTTSQNITCDDSDTDDYDDVTFEYCPDHEKPLPVVLPELQDLTFGGFYRGSPFLGQSGLLPPGEGGLNPTNALVFMWHSHTERELVNNDIFPGGMLAMAIIEPPEAIGGPPIP